MLMSPIQPMILRIEAEAAISDIVSRGKLPIIVGGTGLYLQSLLGRVSPRGTGRSGAGFSLSLGIRAIIGTF